MKRRLLLLTVCAAILTLAGCSAPNAEDVAPAVDGVSSGSPVPLTGNVFLDAEVDYKPVSNGAGTSVIGKRASITVSKDDALAASDEDFADFAQEFVDGSGFNWWTIFFDDGTGIVFVGSSTVAPEYGKVSYDGTLTESLGVVLLRDDGAYSYINFREQVNGLDLYPSGSTSKYLSEATDIFPDEIFYTPAEENGLKGTIYSVEANIVEKTDIRTGVVAAISSGKIAVLDYGVYSDTNSADYTLPNVGSTVQMILTYAGYSEALELPVFYLGADELCVEAMRQ